jgi:hypothetical protein
MYQFGKPDFKTRNETEELMAQRMDFLEHQIQNNHKIQMAYIKPLV